MPSQEAWIDLNGKQVYTRRWTTTDNPRATILFHHGFVEHCSRSGYLNFFDRFQQAGYNVLAYDAAGFGRTSAKTNSQGKTSYAEMLQDFDTLITREHEAHPDQKLYLYGHSMGGFLTLEYATANFAGLQHLSGVIASAPLINQADAVKAPAMQVKLGSLASKVLPSYKMTVGVPSEDVSRDPVVQKDYASDPLCEPTATLKILSDMLTMGPALLATGYQRFPRTLPLLIYHGDADKVTSFSSSKEFIEKVQADDKTFMPLAGFYHEPHNEPDEDKWQVQRQVQEWLDKRTAVSKL